VTLYNTKIIKYCGSEESENGGLILLKSDMNITYYFDWIIIF
jgi:hypothetical protein